MNTQPKIGPDGTVQITPQPFTTNDGTQFEGVERPEIDLDQEGALLLSPEGIGNFLKAVRFRRINMTDRDAYQAWVNSLDEMRQGLLSCYELGYMHGCADQRMADAGIKAPTVKVKGGKVRVR